MRDFTVIATRFVYKHNRYAGVKHIFQFISTESEFKPRFISGNKFE